MFSFPLEIISKAYACSFVYDPANPPKFNCPDGGVVQPDCSCRLAEYSWQSLALTNITYAVIIAIAVWLAIKFYKSKPKTNKIVRIVLSAVIGYLIFVIVQLIISIIYYIFVPIVYPSQNIVEFFLNS